MIETNSNMLPVTAANVRVNGRYHLKDLDLAFSNSYAGVEFAFKGTALAVEFAATAYKSGAEIYAKVYVDDLEPVSIKIDKPGYYTIVTNLDGDKIHQVRIAKRSESNVGAMIIRKLKINPGGQFYTPEDVPARKILVLGDSIACGYGNLYTGGETVGSTAYEDGCQTFATMLADTYNAQLEVVAISGIGVARIPDKLYPLLPTFLQEDNISNVPYTWTYVPDVVVIELGTNDDANQAGDQLVMDAAQEMIRTVREKYPKAAIVWTYGIMSQNHMAALKTAVEELVVAGDKQLRFLPLEKSLPDELPMGLAGHPSMAGHRRMARELSAIISDMTGWK